MALRTALMFNLRSSPEIGVPHADLYPAALDRAEYADAKGRLHTILAAGYAHSEFSLFGQSLRDRANLMDQGLDVITRALSGERFKFGDRDVSIRPLPRKLPNIYVGGGVPAAAKRAARFGLGFSPLGARVKELYDLYDEECRKLGRQPGPHFNRSVGVHVVVDVEKGWQEAGPYILHEAKQYAAISEDETQSNSPLHGLTSIKAVRKSGMMRVVTPDECVEIAKTAPSISVLPLVGGMPPEIGWRSVKLFTEYALPRIKAQKLDA